MRMILDYAIGKIINMFNFLDLNDDDFGFDERINKIKNDLDREVINNDDSFIESLNKTRELLSSEGWKNCQKIKIFNTNEVNEFEELIRKNIEKNTTEIVNEFVDINIDYYGSMIETFYCYDMTTFNLNLVRILDFHSKRCKMENTHFNEFVANFTNENKDFDWICRLLIRSSSSPIFSDETKEEFLKRLEKPALMMRRTL